MPGQAPNPPRTLEGGVRHHRHVRRAPRRPLRGHTPIILLGVGAALLVSVAGYTLGSFVLGGFASSPPQSAAYGIPNAPPGVSFVQAEALFINSSTSPATGSCTAANLGNLTAPTALTNGAATPLCLSHSAGGYGAGDTAYMLEVSWNATALNATVFKVQVSLDVTPAANDISVTAYVKTS
ncbi:MAG TPA: hypothetical protein VEH10_04385, partial [Thermoplasmata archaeon]|nr:hypothetical protein [Thermoplasmata archaeon]